MAYTDYEDVVVRYPILKSLGKTPMQVNSDFIYHAENELNGLLASHFTVPFSDTHPTVKDICIDLVYLRALRLKDPDKFDQVKSAIEARIQNLKSGAEYIFTGSGTTITPSGGGVDIWSTTQGYHPTHSMLGAGDALTHVDDNRIDAEESERE